MSTFICADCGDEHPASALSEYSRRRGHNRSPYKALQALEPAEIVCADCETEDLGLDDLGDLGLIPTTTRPWTETERFEFCGIRLDPARLQAHYLSY